MRRMESLANARLISYFMTINNAYLDNKHKPKSPEKLFSIPMIDDVPKTLKKPTSNKVASKIFNIIN